MKKIILSLIIATPLVAGATNAIAGLDELIKMNQGKTNKFAEARKTTDEAKKVSCDQLKEILLDDDNMTVKRTVAYDLYKVNCDFVGLAKDLEIETKNLIWFQ
ncbi:MAG: hypothetical protein AB7V00_05220 [Bacilli bacterium]